MKRFFKKVFRYTLGFWLIFLIYCASTNWLTVIINVGLFLFFYEIARVHSINQFLTEKRKLETENPHQAIRDLQSRIADLNQQIDMGIMM